VQLGVDAFQIIQLLPNGYSIAPASQNQAKMYVSQYNGIQ
jgi:hypothetical protein